jgi:hypothetical protein
MQRAYHDMAGHYLVPSEGVTLATLGVPPYLPPADDWDDEYPGADEFSRLGAMPSVAPGIAAPSGISFVDMVRTISPGAEPEVWPADNSAPLWIPDDPRALAGPSFADYLRTIDARTDPDLWREDDHAPFIDAYAKSKPSQRSDATGLLTGGFAPIPGPPYLVNQYASGRRHYQCTAAVHECLSELPSSRREECTVAEDLCNQTSDTVSGGGQNVLGFTKFPHGTVVIHTPGGGARLYRPPGR